MTGRDGHLGELAAALVDGALGGNLRDGALAHVAGCAECRHEVDEQRRLKDRLRRMAEPDPPPELADRLNAIGAAAGLPPARVIVAPGPLDARSRATGAAPARRPLRSRRPATAPGPVSPPVRSRSRQTRRLAGGVTALAMGVAVVVVTVGPSRNQGPAISPAVVRYTVEHAETTGGFPGADPAAGAVMTASADR
jgi:hypothetical protein